MAMQKINTPTVIGVIVIGVIGQCQFNCRLCRLNYAK